MSEDLKIQDLGELSGCILAFGGPYSNLQACKALLAEAERLGIPNTRIICTGDVVGYCGYPKETVDLLRTSEIHIIQGNCEQNIVSDEDDCGCGFEKGSTCSALSDQWYQFARSQLTNDQKAWMGTLPLRIEFTLEGRKIHVLHGSNSNISEFIFPSTDTDRKAAIMADLSCDVTIAGHSGFPFTQNIGSRVWHNPGVIGLPPNDGTSRVWYSLIQPVNHRLAFSHHPLHYDHKSATNFMRSLDMHEYANTLEEGIFPSLSFLPEAEKLQTGVPLQTNSQHILS